MAENQHLAAHSTPRASKRSTAPGALDARSVPPVVLDPRKGARVNNGIRALYAAFMVMFVLAAVLLAITYG
jgi:hypothetical protein